MDRLTSLLAPVRHRIRLGLAARRPANAPFAAAWGLLRQILALLLGWRDPARRDPAKVSALLAETEDSLARTLFESALVAAGRTDIDPADYDCRLV